MRMERISNVALLLTVCALIAPAIYGALDAFDKFPNVITTFDILEA